MTVQSISDASKKQEMAVGKIKLVKGSLQGVNGQSGFMSALQLAGLHRAEDSNQTNMEATVERMWELLAQGRMTFDAVDPDTGEAQERIVYIDADTWVKTFFHMMEHLEGKAAQKIAMPPANPPGPAGSEGEPTLLQWKQKVTVTQEVARTQYSQLADMYDYDSSAEASELEDE